MDKPPQPVKKPRLKNEDDRKVTLSLTLTRRQKKQLEDLAEAGNATPSELVVKRFKLK